MKKKALKTLSAAIASTMVVGLAVGCGGNGGAGDKPGNKNATLITPFCTTPEARQALSGGLKRTSVSSI